MALLIDQCLYCTDKVWNFENGLAWYHPQTGMVRCANSSGQSATPASHQETIAVDDSRYRKAIAGVAGSINAMRQDADLPGFPRSPENGVALTLPAEYGKGRCTVGRWCEDETCVKAGHPGVVPVREVTAEANTAPTETLTLSMDDPTDRALYELSNVIRSKRADYAADSDEFSNFRDMAAMFGGYPWDAANVLEMCKLSRLKALTSNDREPVNESVVDSHRDKAAYAVLAFAMLLAEGATWEGTS